METIEGRILVRSVFILLIAGTSCQVWAQSLLGKFIDVEFWRSGRERTTIDARTFLSPRSQNKLTLQSSYELFLRETGPVRSSLVESSSKGLSASFDGANLIHIQSYGHINLNQGWGYVRGNMNTIVTKATIPLSSSSWMILERVEDRAHANSNHFDSTFEGLTSPVKGLFSRGRHQVGLAKATGNVGTSFSLSTGLQFVESDLEFRDAERRSVIIPLPELGPYLEVAAVLPFRRSSITVFGSAVATKGTGQISREAKTSVGRSDISSSSFRLGVRLDPPATSRKSWSYALELHQSRYAARIRGDADDLGLTDVNGGRFIGRADLQSSGITGGASWTNQGNALSAKLGYQCTLAPTNGATAYGFNVFLIGSERSESLDYSHLLVHVFTVDLSAKLGSGLACLNITQAIPTNVSSGPRTASARPGRPKVYGGFTLNFSFTIPLRR